MYKDPARVMSLEKARGTGEEGRAESPSNTADHKEVTTRSTTLSPKPQRTRLYSCQVWLQQDPLGLRCKNPNKNKGRE